MDARDAETEMRLRRLLSEAHLALSRGLVHGEAAERLESEIRDALARALGDAKEAA